jgi:hypothetical protein
MQVAVSRMGSDCGRAGALIIALIACSLAPAHAQEPVEPQEEVRLGSRIPWRIEQPTATQREATRVLYRFARCTVDAKPEDASALLRTAMDAAEHSGIVNRLGGDNNRCLRGASGMRLQAVAFRGAIANALYLRDYPAFPADRLPVAADRAGEMLTGNPGTMMADFAGCVVRTNPAAVDALLRTRPASDEEHAQLNGMVGELSSCLFRGQMLQVNALTLRSILAESAFTLSQTGAAVAVQAPGSSGD